MRAKPPHEQTVERYNEGILGRQFLTFEYAAVSLPNLPAGPPEATGEPFAVAIATLMHSDDPDPAARKLRSLRIIAASSLDEVRKMVLATIVEGYTRLTPQQSRRYTDLLEQENPKEVREMISIYEERGIEKGIQQGIQQGMQQGIHEGILRGQRLSLLRLLQARFGPLPTEVMAHVETIASSEQLEALMERVLSAASLADMGLAA